MNKQTKENISRVAKILLKQSDLDYNYVVVAAEATCIE